MVCGELWLTWWQLPNWAVVFNSFQAIAPLTANKKGALF
jgi:hypothetical protein